MEVILMMTHRLVRLTKESAVEFVRTASHCDFDIDVANANVSTYTVDAKSMLGVLGLDLSTPLKVSYNGYDQDFEQFLEGNAVVA